LRDRPSEAGELAGGGDGDDRAPFGARLEAGPGAVQTLLGAPGDRDRVGGLAVLALLERAADPGAGAVVPGGFDEQPPRVAGAGLGDRPEAAAFAGGVLRRDQPDVAHQLPWAGEALEVADLCAQPGGGQRVDPAQAAQPPDL